MKQTKILTMAMLDLEHIYTLMQTQWTQAYGYTHAKALQQYDFEETK